MQSIMMHRRPTERLSRQIIADHSSDLLFRAVEPASFSRKIVSISDFLPDATFTVLRNAAERQAQSERVHIPVHKRGATISYHDLHYGAPEIVAFYNSRELREWCS